MRLARLVDGATLVPTEHNLMLPFLGPKASKTQTATHVRSGLGEGHGPHLKRRLCKPPTSLVARREMYVCVVYGVLRMCR